MKPNIAVILEVAEYYNTLAALGLDSKSLKVLFLNNLEQNHYTVESYSNLLLDWLDMDIPEVPA